MNLFRSINLKFSWQLGLALILLFGIPRFIIVLQANQTGNYNFTSIIFLLMWITPFILLSKKGRKLIGITKPQNKLWLIYSFMLGVAACIFMYFIGISLYQKTDANWIVYVSNSYGAIPMEELKGSNKSIYFALFVIIGITFSPIGEELMYRGLIHQSFVSRFGNNRASILDSLAFALVHLAHFGIIYSSGSWKFLFIPALLWMLFIFFIGRLFYFCKSKTGSIMGAIISHAGFNFAMTYFIFYHIL